MLSEEFSRYVREAWENYSKDANKSIHTEMLNNLDSDRIDLINELYDLYDFSIEHRTKLMDYEGNDYDTFPELDQKESDLGEVIIRLLYGSSTKIDKDLFEKLTSAIMDDCSQRWQN